MECTEKIKAYTTHGILATIGGTKFIGGTMSHIQSAKYKEQGHQ